MAFDVFISPLSPLAGPQASPVSPLTCQSPREGELNSPSQKASAYIKNNLAVPSLSAQREFEFTPES